MRFFAVYLVQLISVGVYVSYASSSSFLSPPGHHPLDWIFLNNETLHILLYAGDTGASVQPCSMRYLVKSDGTSPRGMHTHPYCVDRSFLLTLPTSGVAG